MSHDIKMSRRTFIWTIGSLSAMAAVGGAEFALAAAKSATEGSAAKSKAVVSAAWLDKGDTPYPLFQKMVEKATDFSWLKPKDTVLVKLALNSGNPFPATTDPWALDCILKVLKAKGATKILVGDQSGVRNVYWTQAGKQRGSSRDFARNSGLLAVIEANGATPVFFEERGYDSYIATTPKGGHWKTPIYVTSLLNEVDHIVNMPRVGSHGLADFTCGLKNAVGFLREDSRRELHVGGADFYAMFEEINEVPEIKPKMRLTISSSRKVMSLLGPDAGYVVEPNSAPVFASTNLLAHDLYAYAFLQYCREKLTPTPAFNPDIPGNLGNLWDVMKTRTPRNRGFVKYVWGLEENQVPELPVFQAGEIYKHPSIQNYIRLNPREKLNFSVVELKKSSDKDIGLYMQRQLKV
jgi:uncharacterized protein (DUF362 family)